MIGCSRVLGVQTHDVAAKQPGSALLIVRVTPRGCPCRRKPYEELRLPHTVCADQPNGRSNFPLCLNP